VQSTVREYDGTLAVSAFVLAAVLQVLQITFIADGLERVSGQGWLLSILFAIVISSGLLFGTFVTKRFLSTNMSPIFAWTFAALAAIVTGGMAAWTIASGVETGTGRWWFALYLGAVTPAQTVLLGIMSDDLFDMAGPNFWSNSIFRHFFSLVRPAAKYDERRQSASVPSIEEREPSVSVAVAPAEVELVALARELERAVALEALGENVDADVAPPVVVAAVQPVSEMVFANDRLSIELVGERELRLRVEHMSRNKLKDLRSALQRACPAVNWRNPLSGGNHVRIMFGFIGRKANREQVLSALRRVAADV
jgi:hypothetical protein